MRARITGRDICCRRNRGDQLENLDGCSRSRAARPCRDLTLFCSAGPVTLPAANCCHALAGAEDPGSGALSRFRSRLCYLGMVATDPGAYGRPSDLLRGSEAVRVFYLAVAPHLFAPICDALAGAGLATPEQRVVVEKPIGRDLASSQGINDAVRQVFTEDQIYRIGHYLGKETVQNLMVLRFANTLFERPRSAADIDHVQIRSFVSP
jgi:glucose-6-phosphate 1-dehydrogenase